MDPRHYQVEKWHVLFVFLISTAKEKNREIVSKSRFLCGRGTKTLNSAQRVSSFWPGSFAAAPAICCANWELESISHTKQIRTPDGVPICLGWKHYSDTMHPFVDQGAVFFPGCARHHRFRRRITFRVSRLHFTCGFLPLRPKQMTNSGRCVMLSPSKGGRYEGRHQENGRSA